MMRPTSPVTPVRSNLTRLPRDFSLPLSPGEAIVASSLVRLPVDIFRSRAQALNSREALREMPQCDRFGGEALDILPLDVPSSPYGTRMLQVKYRNQERVRREEGAVSVLTSSTIMGRETAPRFFCEDEDSELTQFRTDELKVIGLGYGVGNNLFNSSIEEEEEEEEEEGEEADDEAVVGKNDYKSSDDDDDVFEDAMCEEPFQKVRKRVLRISTLTTLRITLSLTNIVLSL